MTVRPQLPERTPRAKGEPTALDGLLVVDFTRVVAGPACTQTLADFGAEVIKIENPDGGDDTRAYEHAEIGGESAAFLSLNRNKRGIALDFTNPAALEVARALIAKADVVVENFSGGVMKKFGLDYASVAPTNPRLIYCSISAYDPGAFVIRTITMSVSGKRVGTPGYALHGRIPAYRSNSSRSGMLIGRKPPTRRLGRPLQRDAAFADRLEHAVGQGRALALPGLEARVLAVPLDLDAGRVERPPGSLRDLRSDAVARDQGDPVGQAAPTSAGAGRRRRARRAGARAAAASAPSAETCLPPFSD